MHISSTSLTSSLYENRFGLILFTCLSLTTAAVLAIAPKSLNQSPQTNPVNITTKLSQTKLVKGETSTVYLDVKIIPPNINFEQKTQRSSDIIVVLDRSGSMSVANKMPYAKAAVHDLLSRLNDNDRFALVSFANFALVHSPLVTVDADRREQLINMVNSIQPGGGTNMGEGLNSTLNLLTNSNNARTVKVLLLSDGQANQGTTDLNGLSRIVNQLTDQKSILSSIGMGLDFNESLMSSLADYGMGRYTYLENLSGLSEIFIHSLNATRQVFAANSHVQLTLEDGVELIDAAGYPISKDGAHSINIKTGQLLNNSDKKFVLTFKVRAQETGDISLGKLHLAYQQRQGKKLQHHISQQQLTLAVIEPEQRQDAIASINQDVYQQSWIKNNFGRMQKQLSQWVREGNKEKADQVINKYRDEISKAEQQTALPLASKEFDDKLYAIQNSVTEAFIGSRAEQELKRKRAAKNMQMDGIEQQRTQAPLSNK